MVPNTSNYWPFHTDLLVFCLKFILAPVREYLNYYHSITIWLFHKSSKQGVWGNSGQKKALPLQILWNCVTPRGKFKGKNEDLEYGNSPWYFFDQSWKLHFFFSWSLEYPHDMYIYIYIYIYIFACNTFDCLFYYYLLSRYGF